MQFPSKRWGYVGSIPTALGSEQPATSGDVLGNRAHRTPDGLMAWKFPAFDTEAEAREHVAASLPGFVFACACCKVK